MKPTRRSGRPASRHRLDWGPWRLDLDARELYTDPDSHVGYAYPVDLDRCTTSAEVLDWVCQIADKGWGTPQQNAATVAGLVQALVDVLHPQANLCSWGRSKRLTLVAVRRLVAEAAS
jgi:hypothetical protein